MRRSLMCLFVLCACGPAPGRLTVTASTAHDFTTADGYAVHFTKLTMVVGEFEIATRDDQQGPKTGGALDVDLLAPAPNFVRTFSNVPAQRWDAVRWSIAPSTDGGVSFDVEGSVSKDNTNKTFAWSFSSDTLYSNCGEGVRVTSNGKTSVELTVFPERLWSTELTDAGTLEGAAIFNADTDDAVITLDELRVTSVPANYESVIFAHDLADFVSAQVRTVGGFQGERSCTMTAR